MAQNDGLRRRPKTGKDKLVDSGSHKAAFFLMKQVIYFFYITIFRSIQIISQISKEYTVNKRAIRQRRREQKRKRKLRTTLIVGGAVLALIALIGYLIWDANRPVAGGEVPIMPNAADHVPEGQDPGPFNSNPPTSGRHYSQPLDAGFYQAGDPETQIAYPEGHIIHNLEHGYVIFWYNCEILDQDSCEQLKTQIQAVMDDFNGVKLIAFPWPSIEVPLAMTSWGQLQRFETFDEERAKEFVRSNRNRAPEPNAP